jgi:hypothetical protein
MSTKLLLTAGKNAALVGSVVLIGFESFKWVALLAFVLSMVEIASLCEEQY